MEFNEFDIRTNGLMVLNGVFEIKLSRNWFH